MIVVDASAFLFRGGDELHAPHLADVEITQGLRRLVRAGELSPDRAAEAIADLVDLNLHGHPHLDFLTRAWKLRLNITAAELTAANITLHKPTAFDGLMQGWGDDPMWVAAPARANTSKPSTN